MSGVFTEPGIFDRSGGIIRHGYGVISPGGIFSGGQNDDDFMNSLPWILRAQSDYGVLNALGDPISDAEAVATITNRGTASDVAQPIVLGQGIFQSDTVPYVQFDGISNYYDGDFPERLTSGRLFMVFRIIGDGGGAYSRFFGTSNATAPDFDNPQSMSWSLRHDTLSDAVISFYNGGVYAGSGSESGILIHEVLVDGGITAWLNGTPLSAAIVDTSGLDSDLFRVGASFSSFGAIGDFANMDWFATFLLPSDVPSEDVDRVRSIISGKYL